MLFNATCILSCMVKHLDVDGVPEPIRVAARNTIQWASFHNTEVGELSDKVTQMFLTYLAYAGGEVNEFDWVLKQRMVLLYDFQFFVEALDDLASMSLISG